MLKTFKSQVHHKNKTIYFLAFGSTKIDTQKYFTIPLWSPDMRIFKSAVQYNAVSGTPLKETSSSLCKDTTVMN